MKYFVEMKTKWKRNNWIITANNKKDAEKQVRDMYKTPIKILSIKKF